MSTTTAKADADQPWEDTLILAFRDIQWILHNEKQEALMSRAIAQFFTSNRTPQQVCDGDRENIALALKAMATTPPLLAKLDGRAESAAGDVLTAHDDKFFLIEFKSDMALRSSEYTKFLGVLMWLIDPDEHHVLIRRSKKGHFFVTQKPDTSAPSSPVLRKLTLEALTYYDAIISDDSKLSKTIPVHTLLTGKHHGLSLEHMADYLQLLCTLHASDSAGGAHPLKVAVASATGIFWPIADLSQLRVLAQAFNTAASRSGPVTSAFSDEKVKRLEKIYNDYLKMTPEQQKEALKREGKKPSAITPGRS